MKNIKIICFIIIAILVLNICLPIISEANNIVSNSIQEEISNEVDNDIQNEISNEVSNEIENEISNEISNEIKNEVSNEVENNIQNEISDNTIEDEQEEIDEETIDQNAAYGISLLSETDSELGVEYCSHVQDIGWQGNVSDGKTSGTTGRNLKIEAIKISLVNNTSNINIKYSAYVQGTGWQNSVSNGQQAGTTGRNLKMEAIKIWLENTSEYSIAYRTHIQDFGWQNWSYDGTISGRLGDNKKIEAIEIKVVPKTKTKMSVTYSSHVQDIGWQSQKEEWDISGTTGRNLKVEALKVNLVNAPTGVSLKYRTYVENSGWQSWTNNGNVSGTTGQNRKVYGIRMELEGTEVYSVQYRAHVQDIGWTTWEKDGAVAGNIAQGKKIEAIQVRIVQEKNNTSNDLGVEYYTYLQGSSSNENKVEKSGEVSGTEGQNRKMEGIQIELVNAPSGAHIKYKTHVQDIGWMNWVKDGEVSGIINGNLKIEAIQIELEGMDNYTVEYKAHIQDKGWSEWYIDGETAGTTGKNKKIEAIQIRIVPKYKRHYMGIDVSFWQGEIDYNKLVATKKVDFMIARIGWYSETNSKLNVDTQFERNYKYARANKIPLGAYLYSYATSVDEAKREAQSVVNYLKSTGQTEYELPIFYDMEHESQKNISQKTKADMCKAFGETLKNAGYKVGVYSYLYWFQNYMDLSLIPNDYSLWVAQYKSGDDGSVPSDIYKYAETHDIWQYTSSGKIDGINGNVDMNICYRRYF